MHRGGLPGPDHAEAVVAVGGRLNAEIQTRNARLCLVLSLLLVTLACGGTQSMEERSETPVSRRMPTAPS